MKYLYIIILTIIMAACADDMNNGETALTAVTVNVEMPPLADGADIVDQFFSFRNVSTGRTSTFAPQSDIALLPGLYDVSYSARVINPRGADTALRANASSVSITGSAATIGLKAYNNRENDDLIIAEIFFSGTLQSSGNQYYGDDYVKLYNNTDHVIYADGITLFESKFNTTLKFDYKPDIMSEAMTVQALYTVPGNGTDVPVQPGEYLLLADTGIDHRVANPNSFDLSNADFEWYDVSTQPSHLDIDGPVTNLDKWYCYTLSFFVLHNRGFRTVGIARIPVERDTYLKDYWYSYDYDQVTVAGTFPMTQSAYRLPNDWILDAVSCSVEAKYAWNVCDPSLDCGWTACGTIDGDKTRYFHSVRRKLLYIADDGRAVFKDTNNSTEDFNRDCIASEIELQGTACDVSGTPCTQLTYDGVTPMPR